MGSGTHRKWLVFDCPCREHHRVMINLDPDNWPAWSILNPAPLTVIPSIDERRGTTRCHYILREGRIVWV
ncbi:DUF6527 family protein [Embleya sp. NPDC055664]